MWVCVCYYSYIPLYSILANMIHCIEAPWSNECVKNLNQTKTYIKVTCAIF